MKLSDCDISLLHPEPGDVVVVSCDRMITRSQAEHLEEDARLIFPDRDIKVIIVPPHISIDVEKPDA